jgi:hypothetical protein
MRIKWHLFTLQRTKPSQWDAMFMCTVASRPGANRNGMKKLANGLNASRIP